MVSLRRDGEHVRVIFGRKAYRVPQDAVIRDFDRPLKIRETDLDLTTNPEDSVTRKLGRMLVGKDWPPPVQPRKQLRFV